MSDLDRSRPEHPDELLAGYVDGSLPADEMALVERHLSGCTECRSDLDLARTGRAAMASLPEMDPPGIAAGGLAGLGLSSHPDEARRTRRFGRRARATERGEGTRRIDWTPVLAAAAAVAVIAGGFALVANLRGPSRDGRAATGALNPAPPEAVSGPPVIDRGTDYTGRAIDRLATRLQAGQPGLGASGQAPAASPAPTVTGPARTALDSTRDAIVSCLVRGGGLSANDLTLYLEAASFQGRPAYVGAFTSIGSTAHLIVVAVARDTCDPLYEINLPLS